MTGRDELIGLRSDARVGWSRLVDLVQVLIGMSGSIRFARRCLINDSGKQRALQKQ